MTTSLFSKKLEELYKSQAIPVLTHIGHDCWIGRDAVIMDGVRIGNGAIVAARSVVTSDVSSYSIYAGIPARLLKYRFSKAVIDGLNFTQWWNFPANEIEKLNLDDIDACLTILSVEQHKSPIRYRTLCINRQGVSVF